MIRGKQFNFYIIFHTKRGNWLFQICVKHNLLIEFNVPFFQNVGLYLVQGSKAGPTTYTNFDDICYSTGSSPGQFFDFYPSMEWGLILCSSSNGIEVRTALIQPRFMKDLTQSIFWFSWVSWELKTKNVARGYNGVYLNFEPNYH